MTDSDRDGFSASMTLMAEAMDTEVSPERIKLYFAVLRDYELDELDEAMRLWLQRGRFFPKPAELIALMDGSDEDRAELAWVRYLDETAIGAYATPDFADDQALEHAILGVFGSWAEACRLTTAEAGFKHAEFRRVYRALAAQGETAQTHRHRLLGLFALTNGAPAPPDAIAHAKLKPLAEETPAEQARKQAAVARRRP